MNYDDKPIPQITKVGSEQTYFHSADVTDQCMAPILRPRDQLNSPNNMPVQNISINSTKVLDRVTNNDLYKVEHLNNSPTSFLEVLTDEDVNRPLLNCPDIDPDCNYFNDLTYNTTYSTLPSDSTQFTHSPTLSVMHLNCRSILNKLEIKDLLTLIPVTVLA